MIIDVTGVPLIPGNGGEDCPGNGRHTDEANRPIPCCCDECDYMMCCYEGCERETCTETACPRIGTPSL